MELDQLSQGTQERIAAMRRQANNLKASIKPKMLQRTLDNILQDLDHIPKMVSSEPYVSAMLNIPQSTLNAIQDAFDRFGEKLAVFPDE